MNPSTLLDQIATAMRSNLPPGVSASYFDGFLTRNRSQLLQVLETQLATRFSASTAPPEEWTASRRTAANLAAMQVAATVLADQLTLADRRTLAGYSGWGGRG